MRRFLAAMLLAVQLQPLAGPVLCLAASRPASSMEQMAGMDRNVPTSPHSGSTFDAAGVGTTAPDCPLVNACTSRISALVASSVVLSSAESISAVALIPVGPAVDLARLAPPTPPPNL